MMTRARLEPDGPEVAAIGLGCMGMSAFYGETDEGEALRTIARALELGCNFLDTSDMYGPHTNERLVGKAIAVASRRRLPGDEVRDQDRAGRPTAGLPCARSTAAPSTCAARATRRCSASASSTSTSTTSTASTRTRRSRRRSPRWPSSSRRARSATSGSRRRAPRRSAARTRCTRSRPCRPSTRCGRATSRRRSCRRSKSSASRSSPTRRSAAASCPGASARRIELDENDFRRYGPRFTGENLQANLELAAIVEELAAREGRDAGAAGARVGAAPRRAHRPDPRHQARVLPGRERRRRGRRAERRGGRADRRGGAEAAPARATTRRGCAGSTSKRDASRTQARGRCGVVRLTSAVTPADELWEAFRWP